MQWNGLPCIRYIYKEQYRTGHVQFRQFKTLQESNFDKNLEVNMPHINIDVKEK